MRVGVLAYEGCLAAEIFVFTDLLLIANRVADGAPADPFEVSVIAASGTPVVAAGGFSLGVQEGHHDIDHLVVPGFELVPSEDPATRLSLWEGEIEFIRACEARGVRVSSVCVGAYLLGEAGLLDGRRCTTSWLYGADLASRYPGATVRTDSLIVQDDGVTTTAAFTAALDLATALVREHLGDKIARTTARITLAPENRTSQAPYILDSMLPAKHTQFADDVGRWLVERMAEPYDLDLLSSAFHLSTRTMLRKFKDETGESPRSYLQRARIRKAKRLLESTDWPLGKILEHIGYQDPGTFRRLFTDRVGISPADYRKRFRNGGAG
ncbi:MULTISPECIES: GlxA family transcriptional regulator [unclassified Rhodococcus (in: high G+C Gram-positive bacteria)]|uniref:GlxA family transcriptional regulator n=1 Tax=unclassified Rhodococcus (in: high G+C Gram-positive bacteria) TaxID=192944 RepID=UPI0024B77FC8|nr:MULTISPECIES: helix-turn-helix domain-containing protein [unclassified Rhodococcus (in: high G+C Gram-positive bacteria)]MDI9958975.1 helix-turn-helix domain-containing protein [Rhodococcus sp. IEGM 1237]MDI9964621.1 helix-turn-helix domain-containing protein [Rhodococcus sp. IEGM 1251]MDV8126763.1 helix-turn-helix domain-containing protein [Rhodococcus sp. IEGM 1304]WNF39566.1 helix-turn-helix domain-containing protein [Rhodococcus sp. SG20037]